jgi:hypothetical protein
MGPDVIYEGNVIYGTTSSMRGTSSMGPDVIYEGNVIYGRPLFCKIADPSLIRTPAHAMQQGA